MSQETAIHRIEQSNVITLYTFIIALTAAVAAVMYVTVGQRQAALVAVYGAVVLVATNVTDWYRDRHS
jgi:hypothetical protein